MFGLESIGTHSPSRGGTVDESEWVPLDTIECELCESRRATTEERGMRVCRTCDRELLP